MFSSLPSLPSFSLPVLPLPSSPLSLLRETASRLNLPTCLGSVVSYVSVIRGEASAANAFLM